jgi:pre-mRNA-splicing factor ATP-dependent RNA helicase DHX15/PRP43
VLYHEFVLTSKNFIRTVSVVDKEILYNLKPEYFNPDTMDGYAYKREFEKERKKHEAEESDDE